MQPLVSVIMPAYNGEKYIKEAVDSIMKQTYQNWELIVIDDASTDNTLKILNFYSDKRVHVLRNEKNMGIAYTSNRAIKASRGKYIALLDDDDVSTKERLEKQVEYLECHPEIDILGGRTLYINENSEIIGQSDEPRINPNYIKSMLLFGGVGFSNSTAMIRHDFILNNGLKYEDQCYGMQDVAFYMDASKIGKISAIKDYLLLYRFHEDSETFKNFRLYTEERKKKYAELQNKSILSSGFKLTDSETIILNSILSEVPGRCENRKELEDFYGVLKKISFQAKAMGVAYANELDHVLRTRFSWQIISYKNLFEDY